MAVDLPPAAPPPTQQPPAIVLPAPSNPRTTVVESHDFRYTVTGNTLLSDEAIRAALEPGTFPQEAINGLIQAYRDAGYFLVTIVATVTGNDVEARVVQGHISDTEMPSHLARYFASELNRDDLKRNDLTRDAALAENYDARQGVRPQANFSPGSEFAGTKMTIVENPIEGSKWWSGLVSFGNLGNRYTSRYSVQASGSVRPGDGIELSGSYNHGLPDLAQESTGSWYEAGSAAGSIVTPWGVYSTGYTETHYKIGPIASVFSPHGIIKTWNVTGTQLVFASDVSRFALTESVTGVDTRTTVDSGFGLFDLTVERYNYLTLGGTYNTAFSVLGKPASLTFSANLLRGLSDRTGTFADPQPGSTTPRFTIYQASASYVQNLPAGFVAGLSANGQWAEIGDQFRLPSNQQWVLGGYGNLTAWYPGVVSGDSGTLVRASGSTPALTWRELSLTPSIFGELATSRTSYIYPAVPNSQVLGDAGIGLTATAGRYGSVNVAYAWPLYTRDVPTQSQSRAKIFFNATLSF